MPRFAFNMNLKLILLLISLFICFTDGSDYVNPVFDFESAENAKSHFTYKYKFDDYNRDIVLRRGYNFSFFVKWNRPCDSNDRITLIFKLRTFRNNNKHSVTVVANDAETSTTPDDWSASYFCEEEEEEDDVGIVTVHIPKTASIGAYGLIVQEKHNNYIRQHIAHKNLGIIFNPYLKGEAVYKETGLEEYIDNERATIYVAGMGRKTWLLAQFEATTIEATFFALNKCNLTAEERSSPVEVARAISAISNDNDDWGILIGRWDGKYVNLEVNISETDTVTLNATAPSRWFGSSAILQQYRETQLPVPYGQCWVFAGLITTMLRTLGIPSRPVTCYSCGHDTDNNLMIDYYLDSYGKKSNKTKDSIWNYHVWVQAYMARDDLKSGGIFNGWQDVDGTPQEKSGPKFQMGPTPVNAVKIGVVDAHFDLPFVYSEVNADIVWYKGNDVLYIETSKIGTKIVTKNRKDGTIKDITDDYKAKEKSKMERQTLHRIASKLNINHPSFNSSIKQRSLETKHINAEIKCDDSLNLGQVLPINLAFKPESWSAYNRKTKTIQYTLTIKTMHYDGHMAREVKTETKQLEIKNAKAVTINTVLPPGLYADSADYSSLLLSLAVKDVKTGALALKEKEVVIKIPEVKFGFKGQTKNKKYIVLTASFTNPLLIAATNCAFSFESEALERKEVKVEHLKEKGTAIAEFMMKTPNKGKDLVMVSFGCDQIQSTESEFRVFDTQSWKKN